MTCSYDINILRQILFLILFFKLDGFAFRYPMNVFFGQLKLSEEDVLKFWNDYNNSDSGIQLYFHNIYCDTRCSYCDCESWVKKEEKDILDYTSYLFSEVKKYGKVIKKEINSIYFGGGTFNLLSDNLIKDFCDLLHENFIIKKTCIWQVEIHPYYIGSNTLEILKNTGVTDLMIGIQSTSEKVNSLNNRKFSKEKLDKIIDDIIRLKFRKISFDLMYNIPYMSENDLISDIEYIIEIGKKINNSGVKVNIELNRWDISMKTTFANLILSKYGKEKFFDFCKYYIKNSSKLVNIVDTYIDNTLLGLFDTDRDEIEERRYKNTAILGIGISSTSYIPGVIAYENNSYGTWTQENIFKGYKLQKIDEDLFFVCSNIRRGIPPVILDNVINNSDKFAFFNKEFSNNFILNNNGDYCMNISSDIENDILNIFLIHDNIREDVHKLLLEKWEKIGFTKEDLDKYCNMFLNYYYTRNKLYG